MEGAMKPDPAEGNEEKDSHLENQETSITHGIYVVVALTGCALAVWGLIEFAG